MTEASDRDLSRLELLTREHVRALERFERRNREFFAAHVADRGDDYFAQFDDLLGELVEENRAGRALFFVIVSGDGEILGRVNLRDIETPAAELGFRIDESAQGRGLATRNVRKALDEAASQGVLRVTARASTENLASQRILERSGFTATGSAETPPGSSRSFLGYTKTLGTAGA